MFAIAIHGGAGVINRNNLNESEEKRYRAALEEALDAGYQVLTGNGTSLDAIIAAVKSLEDNQLFNAGKGSVFTADGTHEMEAAVMDGATLNAGAVCGLRNIRNPVSLAKSVMIHSNHLFLNGQGAEKFAKEMGETFVPDEYFFSQKRFDQLQEARKNERVQLDHHGDRKFGTVGAVALDNQGNLAAATSTGGLTNKNYGRIGDTPLIGAGTYANNKTCAVSCTGDGEYFIRGVTAYDISCLMEYKNMNLNEACELVIKQKMVSLKGEGGCIAIDSLGNIAMVFNSEGMYRASQRENEGKIIEIYGY